MDLYGIEAIKKIMGKEKPWQLSLGDHKFFLVTHTYHHTPISISVLLLGGCGVIERSRGARGWRK